MIVYRFMSFGEFKKYLEGKKLVNETDFSKEGMRTSSKGFCFMEYDDIINSPEYSYNYLSGIVSEDVCCVFATEEKLHKSYGVYANPDDFIFGGFFHQQEYCTTQYNNKTFKLIKFALPPFYASDWNWFVKDMEDSNEEQRKI